MRAADVLRDFERLAIAKLCRDALSSSVLTSVLEDAELVSLDHTGAGYLLTVRHDDLPTERVVCSQPPLMARGADIDLGFIVFLQDRELMLECHTWGDDAAPTDIRDHRISLRELEDGQTASSSAVPGRLAIGRLPEET